MTKRYILLKSWPYGATCAIFDFCRQNRLLRRRAPQSRPVGKRCRLGLRYADDRRGCLKLEHDGVRTVALGTYSNEYTMSGKTLANIARDMTGIDISILSTHTVDGEIASRPMSNNGDVTYNGTSYYFTFEQARSVTDIQRDPKVALGFTSEGSIFADGLYVAAEGTAELIRDKTAFKEHWTPDLDKWFDKGVDTPGLVLIKVRATRVTYWQGEEEGEVAL